MWPYASVSASWAMFPSDSLQPRPPLSSGPNRRATNPSSSWAASRRSELRSGVTRNWAHERLHRCPCRGAAGPAGRRHVGRGNRRPRGRGKCMAQRLPALRCRRHRGRRAGICLDRARETGAAHRRKRGRSGTFPCRTTRARRELGAFADRGGRERDPRARRPEYALVADVEAFFRSRGCPENFQILGAGGKEVRGMHPPGERCLVPGDLVTTELTPCVDGYYAQICRTLVLGQPSETQKRAFAVYNEALERGIAAVRTGATAGDVARAQNEVFRRQGLGDYVTSVYTRVRGHGLGLYVDGRPALLEDVDLVLEPDMTLIVHPNTYHPEVGYFVHGDSVCVTPEGCEVLTRTPRELFSVPIA